MSRIGKLPIVIPQGVKVDIQGQTVSVQGPKGKLTLNVNPLLSVKQVDGKVVVERQQDEKKVKALHGLTRTLIANMVKGVSQGYSKALLIVGMGYRAAKQGNNITINIGFSHPVVVKPVPGVELSVEGTNKIVVSGADKQLVGQVAANLRAIRPPDSYKGKGILYDGERPKLKLGKAGKAAAKK
jgi:large subunit ribosomal protein L6